MISAYEYLISCVSVKIAPSLIHGVGVFALRDIKPGEKLFVEWSGDSGKYPLTQQQIDSLDKNIREHVYDMFEFSNTGGQWRLNIYLEKGCHWIFKTPSHWVNSCSWDSEPNVDLDNFVALKLIKSGTELLSKYGKYQKRKLHRAI